MVVVGLKRSERARGVSPKLVAPVLLALAGTACTTAPPAPPVPPIKETITSPLVAPGVAYVLPYLPDKPLVLETLEPRTDLTSPTPQTWTFYAEVQPGLLIVGVASGTTACYAPAPPSVREYPDRVEVGVSIGTLPGIENCAAIGETIGVRIHLTSPLAGRLVSDTNR